MKRHLFIACRITLVLLVLVSGIYPLLVWTIGQTVFRDRANGSLIVRDGQIVGSSLIGQSFTSDRYFHPRPSAVDFNAAASGGSNLGPTSRKLRDAIAARRDALLANGRARDAKLPADSVTTSASGLDPHISPRFAALQVARVARARHLDEGALHILVAQHTEGRFLGIYGELRVNVLQLNLALDARSSMP